MPNAEHGDTSKPKRQFTLRSMLWKITVFAVGLAMISAGAKWQLGKTHRRQGQYLLNPYGGTTTTASATDSLRTKGQVGRSRLGLALFNHIEYIDFSVNSWPRKERQAKGEAVQPVDDEAAKILVRFKYLKRLNLRGAEITDAGLPTLSRLRDLEQLDISGTRVTQSGLDQFQKKNPKCEIINDPNWESERSPLCLNYWLTKEIEAAKAAEGS